MILLTSSLQGESMTYANRREHPARANCHASPKPSSASQLGGSYTLVHGTWPDSHTPGQPFFVHNQSEEHSPCSPALILTWAAPTVAVLDSNNNFNLKRLDSRANPHPSNRSNPRDTANNNRCSNNILVTLLADCSLKQPDIRLSSSRTSCNRLNSRASNNRSQPVSSNLSNCNLSKPVFQLSSSKMLRLRKHRLRLLSPRA